MKKVISIVLAMSVLLSMAACSRNKAEEETQPVSGAETDGGAETAAEPSQGQTPEGETDGVPGSDSVTTGTSPAQALLAEFQHLMKSGAAEPGTEAPGQQEETEEAETPEESREETEEESPAAELSAEEMADRLVSLEWIPFSGMAAAVEPGYLAGFTEEIEGFAEGATFCPIIGSIPFVGYIFRLEEGADVQAFVQNLKDKADLRWNICTTADEMVCEAVDNTVFFVMSPAQFGE